MWYDYIKCIVFNSLPLSDIFWGLFRAPCFIRANLVPVTYSDDKTSRSALAHTRRRRTPCGNGHCWHSYISSYSSFQRVLLGILEGERTNKANINPPAKLARVVVTWNKELAKGNGTDGGERDLSENTNRIFSPLSKTLPRLTMAVTWKLQS